MFDSQICSLASITFLVHLLGLAIAIGFRLQSPGSRASLIALVAGMFIMTASTFACLLVDRPTGLAQGVALVSVAVLVSWKAPATGSAGF
jgi:hypothetical protein